MILQHKQYDKTALTPIIAGISSGSSSLSDYTADELEAIREEIRLEWCNGDESAYNKLRAINMEMYRRNDDGEEVGYPVHREHGWYLPSDD